MPRACDICAFGVGIHEAPGGSINGGEKTSEAHGATASFILELVVLSCLYQCIRNLIYTGLRANHDRVG